MADAERLQRLLAEARARFGAEALARIEEPIRAFAGLTAPAAAPHPLQRPHGLYVPGLKAAAWHDRGSLEDVAILERSAADVRAELEQLLSQKTGFQPFDEGPDGFYPESVQGSWNVFYFRWGFQDVADNQTLCPRTSRLLASLPNLAQSAMFSALTPGTHLDPHCGPINGVLSLSLGVRVPLDCALRVGGEARTWTEGECLVFDDSFEHEAWNRGPQTRFVLLLDVWHPDLTPVERSVLRQVLWAEEEATAAIERHRTALQGETWW